MDFGLIKGDNLRILHQAFITDIIDHALQVDDAEVRLYHIDTTDRKRLVKVVVEFLEQKLEGAALNRLKRNLTVVPLKKDRWGVRIEQVFQDCFAEGHDRVIVVGSRTPTVTPMMMRTALNVLNESDAVFGPTPDGRYYMIGMAGSYHIKLADFDWKSPKIYSEVAAALSDRGLSWSELEIWYAVEQTDDIEFMVRDINQFRFEGELEVCVETEKVMERILALLE